MDLTGKVLIAMPGMGDPRFDGSVVYICSHSQDGAMGLIINKPLRDLRLAEVLRKINLPPGPHAPDLVVHFGGPVETGRGFVLHSADYRAGKSTLYLPDQLGMTATRDILEAMALGMGPQRALITLGYAGWGEGQLESEIADNGWLTAESSEALLFAMEDDAKWAAALQSIGVSPLMLSAQAGRA
jgi:putative transcriptional regulator